MVKLIYNDTLPSVTSHLESFSFGYDQYVDHRLTAHNNQFDFLSTTWTLIVKACHCDCFFRRKAKLAIRLFQFIPRCPYYDTFFAFRRSGLHPPF